mgnify:CR=1 FL=1
MNLMGCPVDDVDDVQNVKTEASSNEPSINHQSAGSQCP